MTAPVVGSVVPLEYQRGRYAAGMAPAKKGWSIDELEMGGLRFGVYLDGELVTRREDRADAEEFIERQKATEKD